MAGEGYPAGGGTMSAAQILLRTTGAAALAAGALLFGAGTALISTLPIGTAGQILTVTAGAPAWGPNLGAALPSSYVIGDVLYASSTTALSRLADVAAGSVLVSGGVGAAPAWSASPTVTGTIGAKPATTAGIQLDPNAATGNFTLSLSPANITAARRWSFPDRSDTVAGLAAQTFTGAQAISNATASTSGITGALIVTGGIGTSDALYAIGGLRAGPTASLPSVGMVRVGDSNADYAEMFRLKNSQSSAGFYFIIGGTTSGSVAAWNSSVILESDVSAAKLVISAINGGITQMTGAARGIRTTLSDTQFSILPTTASSSTTTGSLVNAGGFGNAGTMYVGGAANFAVGLTTTGSSAFTLGLIAQASSSSTSSSNFPIAQFYNTDNTNNNGVGFRFLGTASNSVAVSGANILCQFSSKGVGVLDGTLLLNTALAGVDGNRLSISSTSMAASVPLTVTQGTITSAVPAISSTVTWNAGGVTFTALKLNVTDTASAAASLLLDLQVGGVSKFSVRKDGLASAAVLALAGGTVTVSTPIIDATQTWNAGAVAFTGIKLNITNTASDQLSLLMDLQIGGTSTFSVGRYGVTCLQPTNAGTASSPIPAMTITPGSHTSQLNNDLNTLRVNGATIQWAGPVTVAVQQGTYFRASTYTASSASTMTSAATVAIEAAPTGAAGMTITNAWALWVRAGTTRLDGALEVSSAVLIKSNTTLTNGAAAAAGTLANAPAAGNPTKWIPINDNGTTRYLPAW